MIEVPCACPVAPTPSSKGSSKGTTGGGNNVAPTPSGWGSDGHRNLQWGSDGHSNVFKPSGGSESKPSGGSKGSNVAGGSKSGGSKGGFVSGFSKSSGGSKGSNFSGSKSSYTYTYYSGSKSKSSGSSTITVNGSGSKGSKGSYFNFSNGSKGSKGSYFNFSKGSAVTGSCTCLVPVGSSGSSNISGSQGSCTCLAPAMSGSKGSKGTTGLVPVSCPCSEPIPVAPSICEPTPVPSPAPTPCGDAAFFFYQGTCSNAIFVADTGSYATVEACCNINFGIGSYSNGGCSFVDTCNPSPTPKPTPKPISNFVPPTTPAPTPCGSGRFFFVNGVCTNEVFVADVFSYDSLISCCNINFGTNSYEDKICDYVDECNTPMPSLKPTENIVTPEPTPSPVTPAPTPCDAQVFYFNGDICSNEFYIADAMSYSSVSACCDANFGSGSSMNGGCNYVDTCSTESPTPSPVTDEPTPSPVTPEPTPSPVTPAPTPCDAQVFFFNGDICSNEFLIADAMSYSSLVACCDANFGSGSFMSGGCDYTDACSTEPPSPSPTVNIVTPAPTPCEAQVFFFDGLSCSNEMIIADASSYDSLDACCSDNFGSMSLMTGDCQYTDMCNTLPPSPAPMVTIQPTFGSTPTVSTETTGPPTLPDRGDQNRESQPAWFTVVGNP
jgi:hypothetical protein